MREIKFRLLMNGEIVGYEWHRLSSAHGMIDIFHMINIESGWYNVLHDPSRYIDHDDKEQFTGKGDKNDVEIYERDIWKIDTFIGVVEFKFCKWILTRPDHKNVYSSPFFHSSATAGEIIGNIHKNPGLIGMNEK